MIDTNAIIDYLGEKLPPSGMGFMNDIVNAVPNLSVITKIEILGFNAPNEHHELLNSFMEDSNIFSLTENIVDRTIAVRKNHKTKLPDAIIAATALENNFKLISRNTSDFKNIQDLQIIDPHKLK